MKIFESICIVMTLKCDLSCKHCFIKCGPNRKEIIKESDIQKIVMNTAPFAKRIWISGGEPTTNMKILIKIIEACTNCKEVYGYPQEICVQTNANWAKNDCRMKEFLDLFEKKGVTDIDISSNDPFHFEQIGDTNTPNKLFEFATKNYKFKSVNLDGTPLKGLKPLGRAKEISGFLLNTISENCSCYNDNFLVYPNGDVYNCKWAITIPIGNILNGNIENVYNSKEATFGRILFEGGPQKLAAELEKRNICVQREEKDICDYCRKISIKYKEIN